MNHYLFRMSLEEQLLHGLIIAMEVATAIYTLRMYVQMEPSELVQAPK